jgi:hypothetical protein
MQDSDLIGKTQVEAEGLIKSADLRSRVVKVDGKSFVCTMDYRPDRINLTLEKGKVIDTRRG